MADEDILQDRLDRVNRIGTDQPAIILQALSARFDALEAAYTSLAVRRRAQQGQEDGIHGDDQDASEAFEIWACRHIHSGTLDLVCGSRFDDEIARIYDGNRKSRVRISNLAAKLGVTPRVLVFVLGAEIVRSETAQAAIRALVRKMQLRPQPQQVLLVIAQRFFSVKADLSVHHLRGKRRRWGDLRCFKEAIIHYMPDDPDPTLWPINKGTRRQKEERQRKAGDRAAGDEEGNEQEEGEEEDDREGDPEPDERKMADVHPSSRPDAGNAAFDRDPTPSPLPPSSPFLRARTQPPRPPQPPPIPLEIQHDNYYHKVEAEEITQDPNTQGAGGSGSSSVWPRDEHDDVTHPNTSENKGAEDPGPFGGTRLSESPEAARVAQPMAASVENSSLLNAESESESDTKFHSKLRMQDQPEDQDNENHHNQDFSFSEIPSPEKKKSRDELVQCVSSSDEEHDTSEDDLNLLHDAEQEEESNFEMIEQKSDSDTDKNTSLDDGTAEENVPPLALGPLPTSIHDKSSRSRLPLIATPTTTMTTSTDSDQPRTKQHKQRRLLPTLATTQKVLTGITARLQHNKMLSDEDIVFCLGHRLVSLGHHDDDDDTRVFQVFEPGFPYHDSESGKLRRPETLALHLLFFFNYRSHWTLGHLDCQTGLLTHYDSYQSYGANGILGSVEARMQAWALDHKLGPIRTIQCKQDEYPQQKDNINCGIFTVECAASLITSGAPPKSVNPQELRNTFLKMAKSELQEQIAKNLGHVTNPSKRLRPDVAAQGDYEQISEHTIEHERDSSQVGAQAHMDEVRHSQKRQKVETRGQQHKNGPNAAGRAGGASGAHPQAAQTEYNSGCFQAAADAAAAEVAGAKSSQRRGWVLNTLTGLDGRLGTSFSTSLQKYLSHDGPLLLSGLRKEQAQLEFDHLKLARELTGLNEQQGDGEEGEDDSRNHGRLGDRPVSLPSTTPSITSMTRTSADIAGCSSLPTGSTIIQHELEMACAEEKRMALKRESLEGRYMELIPRALSLQVEMTPEESQQGQQDYEVHSDLTQSQGTSTITTTATTTSSTTSSSTTATGQAKYHDDHHRQQQAVLTKDKSSMPAQPASVLPLPQPARLIHALGSIMAEAGQLIEEIVAISQERKTAHTQLDAARAKVNDVRAKYIQARRSEIAQEMARIAAQIEENRLILQWLRGLGWE